LAETEEITLDHFEPGRHGAARSAAPPAKIVDLAGIVNIPGIP
jgi:hypothetical protein